MPPAQGQRCVSCNKPLHHRVPTPCGTVVCSELCARRHVKGCADCLALIPSKPGRSMSFGATCLTLGLLGFALFAGSACIVGIIKSGSNTSASQVAQQTSGQAQPPTGTTGPTAPTGRTQPTAPVTPTARAEAPPLKPSELNATHDRQTVRVRGKVTEAEAATALTLDGTLSVTFASTPSPAPRLGQELTVEGTCFVVAGKPKMGRARVVE